MTHAQTQCIARAAAEVTPHSFHLLRKCEVEISGFSARATRLALASSYATADSRALFAVHNSGFFADRRAFGLFKNKVVPGMIAAASPGQTIRVWIPGCGTGEESYSIAMLFLERIRDMKKDVGLQIFATDIEPDAIAFARAGVYPAEIQDRVPATLLGRYFKREGNQFRIVPALRETIVFNTHNVLADVPFSRLDLISCRNVVVHLPAEAQSSLLFVFHFALRRDGLLFVSAAESVIRECTYFESVSEANWIPRRPVGHSGTEIVAAAADTARLPQWMAASMPTGSLVRQVAMQYLIDNHIPAAVLVDKQNKVLHFFGPIHRYLTSSDYDATQDLVGCVKAELRPAFVKALRQAARGKRASVIVTQKPHKPGSQVPHKLGAATVIVQAVPLDVGAFLVSFLNAAQGREIAAISLQLSDALADLERSVWYRRETEAQLDTSRAERSLVDESYNVALEELASTQSELHSLGMQYQTTAAEYKQAADDIENILSSSGTATVFLDDGLRVRFLSQTAQDICGLSNTDIGRSLADISGKFGGTDLLMTARTVLSTFVAVQYELKTGVDTCYSCRIAPYRKKDGQIKGVVIQFFDISALKQAEFALTAEKKRAEAVSLAKSRFLAAASHDLRQPLQTLRILQELLLPTVKDGPSRELVTSSLNALTAMSGLLNTLLDINQLESGVIHPTIIDFPISQLLQRLESEFAYHAQGRGLELRVVPCALGVRSDPHLLEDMLRNLLSNAVKYTKTGRILFGCRRHENNLRIEVWDTGVGIPEAQLKAIFFEYHQIESHNKNSNRGLGLGLSIVEKLATLLGHKISVHSRVGCGSVFSIEVMLAPSVTILSTNKSNQPLQSSNFRKGNILIIEDELDVRKSYERLLQSVGHHTTATADADEAIAQISGNTYRPDLVIADYSLSGDCNGVKLAARLRKAIGYNVPTVILTGDISMETLREISQRHLIQRSKPLPANELCALVQSLLSQPGRARVSRPH